ncbi:MAG: DNA-directed RNA polymerase subunit RpoH/Rpb5 C-terminal domain-containing protein [archaeon]
MSCGIGCMVKKAVTKKEVKSVKKIVLEHFLLPERVLLTKEETEALITKFGTNLDLLPQILKSDPVVSDLDGKPGEIIRFTRKGFASHENYYYRVIL